MLNQLNTLYKWSTTPIMPIFFPFLSTTILLLYRPCNSGSKLSLILHATTGNLIVFKKGTIPSIESSNSWLPNV